MTEWVQDLLQNSWRVWKHDPWHLAEYYRGPRVNYAERKPSMRNDANGSSIIATTTPKMMPIVVKGREVAIIHPWRRYNPIAKRKEIFSYCSSEENRSITISGIWYKSIGSGGSLIFCFWMENWIAIKSGSIFTHVSINIFSDSICFSRFRLIERNTKRVKTVFCECDSLKIARTLRKTSKRS